MVRSLTQTIDTNHHFERIRFANDPNSSACVNSFWWFDRDESPREGPAGEGKSEPSGRVPEFPSRRAMLTDAAARWSPLIATDRNAPQGHVWRWREWCMENGVAGLLQHKIRPPGRALLVVVGHRHATGQSGVGGLNDLPV